MYDTHFRQLDPQIGRWWQVDPKPHEMFSPYVAMADNPMLYSDPMGDTTWVYGMKGQYLGTINDKLKNQVHFVNNSNEKASPFDATKLSGKEAKSLAKSVRSTSVAFMGSKTASDMRTIVTKSDQYRKEVGFVGSIGKDREIRLTAMPIDKNNSFNSVNIGKQLDKNYSPEQQAGFFLAGHTHEGALLNGFSYGSNMANQMGLGEPSNHGDKSDYYPMLYQNGNISDRSQTPALIATPYGSILPITVIFCIKV